MKLKMVSVVVLVIALMNGSGCSTVRYYPDVRKIYIPAKPKIPVMPKAMEASLSDEAYLFVVKQMDVLKAHIIRLEDVIKGHNTSVDLMVNIDSEVKRGRSR